MCNNILFSAPPTFIQKLHPYTGALYSAKNASLSCRVECVPSCSISWFKDGNGIEENDRHYTVKETFLPADPSTGDFESVLSVLVRHSIFLFYLSFALIFIY